MANGSTNIYLPMKTLDKITHFLQHTSIKNMLKKIAYSLFVQEIICFILQFYMYFVYITSKRKFINNQVFIDLVKNKQPIIVAFWHNRLVMIPFLAIKLKKSLPKHKFMTLASKHGDGQFVGKIMQKFGFIAISGSTNNKKNRGIDFSSMRKIISGLKKQHTLGITPDGPKGPALQINGELINIAKTTGASIVCASYSAKKNIIFNSWDKLQLPLPFNKITFYLHHQVVTVPSCANTEQIKQLTNLTTHYLTLAQKKSQSYAHKPQSTT
jgi:lysophospholipid acyltransferase (LPLAT)-like uncharacterized protein